MLGALEANDGAALVLGTDDGALDGIVLTDGVTLDFTEGNALGADIDFVKLDVQTKSLLSPQPVDLVQPLTISSVVQRRAPASSQTAFASSQVLFR